MGKYKPKRKWEKELGFTGVWSSSYKSIDRLLRYLHKEKSGSIASRKVYSCNINQFCEKLELSPDQILRLPKEMVEEELKSFADDKNAPRTRINTTAALKTFFRINGRKDLDFPKYYCPSRKKVRKEYIPKLEEAEKMAECAGNLKSRAIIKMLYTTGLRNSTLRGLKFGVGSKALVWNTWDSERRD